MLPETAKSNIRNPEARDNVVTKTDLRNFWSARIPFGTEPEPMTEENASHHVFEQMDRYSLLQRLPDTP